MWHTSMAGCEDRNFGYRILTDSCSVLYYCGRTYDPSTAVVY
jgi:hypothetical protein